MPNFVYEGVDYAWQHPSPSCLKANNKKFAMRYLSNDESKNLSKTELAQLTKNNVAVGLVWESNAGRALHGFRAGAEDAISADHQADGLGLSSLPIYFAVDFDITDAQKPAMADYLRGAASMIGKSRVGIYGGFWAVKYAAANKVANYFWQTYAWSGGNLHDQTDIYQYKNGVSMCGGSCDLNRATERGRQGMSGARPKVNRKLVAYLKRQERAFKEYLRVHGDKDKPALVNAARAIYYFYKIRRRKAEKGEVQK